MKKMKKIVTLCLVYSMLFLAIIFSKQAAEGTRKGIGVCLNILIPSLFAFMMISNLIATTKFCTVLARPFKFLFKILFKATSLETTIILLSFIGGYPIGAKLLSNAVKHNYITSKKASILLCFCVNCGPAYLISVVGNILFDNFKIGVILYIAQIFSSIIVGFFVMHFCYKEKYNNKEEITYKKLTPEIFVSTVLDTSRALFVICSFVVAFSGLFGIVCEFIKPLSDKCKMIVSGFFEVTNAVNSFNINDYLNPVMVIAFLTSFGGICVIVQVIALVKQSKINIKPFLTVKLIYVFVVLNVTTLIFKCVHFAPQEIACFVVSQGNSSKFFSVSPISTIFLLSMSIILLFFCRKDDRIDV